MTKANLKKRARRGHTTARRRNRPPRRSSRRIFGLRVGTFLLLLIGVFFAVWVGFHFTEVVTVLGQGLRDSPKHLVNLLVDKVIPFLVRLMRRP